jgi:hypothetical protein
MRLHRTASSPQGRGPKTLFSILLGGAIALAGCGGGGGGSTATGTGSTTAITSTSIAGSLGNVDPATLTSFAVDAGGNDGGIGSGDSGADGSAGEGGPINNGTVIITDSSSTPKTLRVKTNANGYYFAKVTGFTAPLVVKIVSQSGKIYYSLREDTIAPGSVATINITPLTDKVASLVAGTASVSALTPADITAAKVASAKATVVATFSSALSAAGVTNTTAFDPIKTPFKADGTGYDKVLDQVRHETNASGATDLYPKTVAYAADGTVASTPLSPSAPLALVVGGKELNFARLDSLRKQLNACFAQAEAARSYTTVGNACAGLAHPNFKSAGRDFVETVVQMSGRKDRNRVLEAADVMTGAQFDAPELLLLESSVSAASAASATTADLDSAIIELRWYQPANASYRSSAFTMRRFDNFNAAAAPAVQRSAVANADGTSSDWWFYGGQSNYSFSVSPRLQRYVNLNPATNVENTTGTLAAPASGSQDISRLGLSVGTQKFNTATRAWEEAGVAYAKIKGPGLPITGVVLSRIDSATSTGACISSLNSSYDAAGAVLPTQATYLGFYSSLGVLPNSTITGTFVYSTFTSTISVFDFTSANATVGATRSFTFPSWSSGRQSPTTMTLAITIPGGSIASTTIVLPPIPATTSFSVPFVQTAASFGVTSFTAIVTNAAGGLFTNTVTTSAFASSTSNNYDLGRSWPSGVNYPYTPDSALGYQFGSSRALNPTDYSAIKPWSRYTIELYGSAGNLLSTETDRIVTQPLPSQYLRSAPLHDLSPSHGILTASKPSATSLTMQWNNNPAAPTPNESGFFNNYYNQPDAPSSVRRAPSQRLKRAQLSTAGITSSTFAAADVSQFTGCRLPAPNTLVSERLDAARVLDASNNITSYTLRNVYIHTLINRVRITQTTEWAN